MPDFETGREAALVASSARAAVPSKAEARMAAAIAAVCCFFMVVLPGAAEAAAHAAILVESGGLHSAPGGAARSRSLTPHRERLPQRRRPLPGTRRRRRAPRAPS